MKWRDLGLTLAILLLLAPYLSAQTTPLLGSSQPNCIFAVGGKACVDSTLFLNLKTGIIGIIFTNNGVIANPATASFTFTNNGSAPAAIQTGVGGTLMAVPAGGLGLATVSTTSVGNTGQGSRLLVVCGPTAGTASLLFYAGTTNTPVVLANAVGGGLIGC